MKEFYDIDISDPNEEDSIDCHFQQIGIGSLICRAAQQTGRENITNRATPAICHSCLVGKIYREVGCDAPSSAVTIRYFQNNTPDVTLSNIFCNIRRRYTSLEYCQTCSLVTAESTREIITNARGLFTNMKFYSAYQDIEKARLAIRDGKFARSITHSLSCLESTMRTIHDELDCKLPDDKSVSGLWKSTRRILQLSSCNTEDVITPLLKRLIEVAFPSNKPRSIPSTRRTCATGISPRCTSGRRAGRWQPAAPP
jgi:hypothetical protein